MLVSQGLCFFKGWWGICSRPKRVCGSLGRWKVIYFVKNQISWNHSLTLQTDKLEIKAEQRNHLFFLRFHGKEKSSVPVALSEKLILGELQDILKIWKEEWEEEVECSRIQEGQHKAYDCPTELGKSLGDQFNLCIWIHGGKKRVFTLPKVFPKWLAIISFHSHQGSSS